MISQIIVISICSTLFTIMIGLILLVISVSDMAHKKCMIIDYHRQGDHFNASIICPKGIELQQRQIQDSTLVIPILATMTLTISSIFVVFIVYDLMHELRTTSSI